MDRYRPPLGDIRAIRGTDVTKELFIPEKRHKDAGTYFDDLLGKKPPTAEELNSMKIRSEINARPGTHVYVSRATLKQAQSVVALWQRYREVSPDLRVLVDNSLEPGKIEVRYADA
jgi:hypothetical protein